MIKDNILKVKKRILQACLKANRDPRGVGLIAVAKGRGIQEIQEAVNCGISDIGENKVQEALLKYHELGAASYELKWHMVGHLQANKAKDAVRIFDLIHSVDSLRLAEELDKQAAKIDKLQDILIEVNTSGEAAKFGLKPGEVAGVIKDIAQLKNLNVRGLMTIAPIVDNPDAARPYFRNLKELSDKINELLPPNSKLQTLSMGMTDDFEVAIEEGSTMVRIGRGIFA